ncbi:MAG: ABC transporter ATP-binding protein [Candidatus Dormibacteraeota bacterium]|nr:ABC transporter ATP-binding protein [Candidatus Dormibacteraeota bacterium]
MSLNSPVPSVRPPPPGCAVRIRGLSHVYGRGAEAVTALSDVDLEIPAGGHVALMGPSGAGKSTLLSLVGGLDRPQRGELRVGELDLTSLDGDALAAYRRNTVGFVFQHFGLLDLLSARENVELSLALAGVEAAHRSRRAGELLDGVGLSGRMRHRPSALSGGERQRVAIARALANDPGLILADEPTGNLDAETAVMVLDLLQRVHREQRCTLIVVTHNEAVAERADRRFLVHAGRLKA